ncbi:hypothetical protein EBU99_12365, partial [bacterium]|nr:hypothetical protein [bacterium]
ANAGLLTGAVEDTPFVITHKMLQDTYPASDKETPVLTYEVTALGETGSVLKRGTQTLQPNDLPVKLNPGESLTFTPPLNVNYTANGPQKAFSFRVLDADGGYTAGSSIAANVSVAAINDPPQYGTVQALPNALQNQTNGYQISYTMLRTAIPLTDVDVPADTLRFRVESVNNGVLRMGTSNTGVDVTSLTNRPFVIETGADGTLTTTALNWTPPLNAIGNMSVMTLRAFDGTDYASSTVDVRINVTGSNKIPTINAGFTVGGIGTGTTGTYQNVTLPMSYDLLLEQSGAADPDLSNVWFKVTYLESGTLTIGNVAYTVPGVLNPAPVVAPMERISWKPSLNQTGRDTDSPPNPVSAFRIKSYDNIDLSANESLVKVNVAPVNQLPTVSASKTFTGAVRNQVYSMKVYDIADQLGAFDFEDIPNPNDVAASRYTAMTFRIEDILGGQYLKVGTSLASAVTVGASNRVVLPTQTIYWMPPNNMVGTFPAFTFSAIDSKGVTSANVGTVSVTVTGSPDKPVLANVASPLLLSGGIQNVPYVVTHDQLKLALGLSDPDSSWVSFVVTSISAANGELRRGGAGMVSFANGTGTPPSASLIAPRESVAFVPVVSVSGSNVEMFRVRAYDGTNYSTEEAIIQLAINAVNQAPTMNQTYTFSAAPGTAGFGGAARNSPWSIAFEDLAQRLGVADLEDVNQSNPAATRYNMMKFRIEGLLGGQYLKIGGTNDTPATSTDVDTTNNTFNPGQKLWWLPPNNTVGSIEAFTLSLIDSKELPSNYRARITIAVSGVNEKPVIGVQTPPALTGATQNMPFVVTYDTLKNALGVSDVDSSYTSIVVTSTSNGQLKKGTTNISAFTGAPAAPPAYSVLAPSESLVYFPTTNLSGNGIEILKARAYDGTEYSNLEGTITVNLAQVNQRPQINAVFNSTSGVRNELLEIPFATLAAGLGATDLEDVTGTDPTTKYDKLTFRIEQVLGGQSLKLGASANAAGAGLFDANNNIVAKNKSVYWMPPVNSAGTFEAFTVSAIDSANLTSAIVAKVIVTVSGSDKSPTMTNALATIGNVGAGTGATESRPFEITYDTLKSAAVLDVRDEDSSWVSLVVTATSNGTFKKGSNALAIFTGMPAAPPNTAVIAPNESIVFLPTANLNGVQPILKVRAYDGATYSSTEATVQVNIVPVNTPPTMSTLNDFVVTSQAQNAPITFTYDQMRAKTDVADVEEPVGVKQIGFKIKSIAGGQIYRTSVSPKVLLTVNNIIGPNETFEWNAPQILSGRLQAMSVVAVDADGAESATTLPVYFNTHRY